MSRVKKSLIILLSCIAAAAVLTGALVFTGVLNVYIHNPFRGESTEYHIAYVFKSNPSTIDFWRMVEEGINAGCGEYGLRFTILGAAQETDIDGNILALQQAAALGPDAIVLSATDYEQLAPYAEEVAATGILLLTMDSDVAGDAARCFIGTDNYALGRQMGAEMCARVPTGSVIGLVEHGNSYTSTERLRGVRDVLEENGCTLLQPATMLDGQSTAKELTLGILSSAENLAGVIATNEAVSLGVCQALVERGLQNDLAVITCDSSTKQIEYIEQGVIDATVVQKPLSMGYYSVVTVYTLLQNPSTTQVPDMLDTGYDIITLENYFTLENQKLLIPFW